MRRYRRKTLIGVALFFAVYVSGYAILRSEQFIIHRAGYAGAGDIEGPAIYGHSITSGDRSVSAELGMHPYAVDGIIHLVYQPAKWIEQQCWYLIKPKGTPWPY